jgi:ABC-2 type transport system ATP-binding protein
MRTDTSETSSCSRGPGEPLIQLRNLEKRFGDRLAVSALDLEVPAGEIYGLLGHNGAGKSTAIGMMLGQVWPSGGEIRICGHDVTADRRRALGQVGAIFESPAFYDYLSGYRNLHILSSYSGFAPKERIEQVIEWVGLKGREHSKVRTYSHGMRARLALAQALLPRPRLLILDEPSDGLDPEGIHEMRQTILRLQTELGLTILLSSHLLNEVEQLCTRIAVLSQGRKVFDGPLSETRSSLNWVRLRVSDFAAAVALLKARELVLDARNGCLIHPAPNIGPERIVKALVEQGFSVFEIAPAQDSLEQFYLSLMGNPPAAAGPRN